MEDRGGGDNNKTILTILWKTLFWNVTNNKDNSLLFYLARLYTSKLTQPAFNSHNPSHPTPQFPSPTILLPSPLPLLSYSPVSFPYYPTPQSPSPPILLPFNYYLLLFLIF